MKLFNCIFVITCLIMLIASSDAKNTRRRRRASVPLPKPVNCKVGSWTNWGACSVSFGSGVQIRTRPVTVWPEYGGADCPDTTESRTCTVPPPKGSVIPTPNGGAWNTLLDGSNVQWQEIGKDSLQFVISANTSGYVAMAISQDNLMGEDDCYMCMLQTTASGGILKFKSAYLPKRQQPIEITKTANNQHNIKHVDGVMTCTFSRPYDVGIMGNNGTIVNWNLNQNKFHLMFAKGEVNHTSIFYHNANRDVTRIPINFTDPSLGITSSKENIVSPPKLHLIIVILLFFTV